MLQTFLKQAAGPASKTNASAYGRSVCFWGIGIEWKMLLFAFWYYQ